MQRKRTLGMAALAATMLITGVVTTTIASPAQG